MWCSSSSLCCSSSWWSNYNNLNVIQLAIVLTHKLIHYKNIIISYYVPLIGSAALTDALPLSPFTPTDLPIIIIIIIIYNYHNILHYLLLVSYHNSSVCVLYTVLLVWVTLHPQVVQHDTVLLQYLVLSVHKVIQDMMLDQDQDQ